MCVAVSVLHTFISTYFILGIFFCPLFSLVIFSSLILTSINFSTKFCILISKVILVYRLSLFHWLVFMVSVLFKISQYCLIYHLIYTFKPLSLSVFIILVPYGSAPTVFYLFVLYCGYHEYLYAWLFLIRYLH